MNSIPGHIKQMHATTADQTPIERWLDILLHLKPARHLVLAGAGHQGSQWVQWLQDADVVSASLIEAEEDKAAGLEVAVAERPGWDVRRNVVAPQAGPVLFHVASMRSESGLVPPETLRPLWPNLGTARLERRQGTPLDELLADHASNSNWLILDCMPAWPLLQSSPSLLAGLDVLVVRSLLQPDNNDPPDLSSRVLVEELQSHGLRHVASQAGLHPGIGHLLFVRDHPRDAKHEADRLASEVSRLQSANLTADQEAQAARSEVRQLRSDLLAQAEELVQARAHSEALSRELLRLSAQQTTADAPLELRSELQQMLGPWQAEAEARLDKISSSIDQLTPRFDTAEQRLGEAISIIVTKHLPERLRELEAGLSPMLQAQALASQQLSAKLIELQEALLTGLKAQVSVLGDEQHSDPAHATLRNELEARNDELLQLRAQLDARTQELLERNVQSDAHRVDLSAVSAAMTAVQEQHRSLIELQENLARRQDGLCGEVTGIGGAIANVSDQYLPNAFKELRKALLSELTTQLTTVSSGARSATVELESRLRADVNKGLANAVKQVESFISIQSYLTTGDAVANFHGWPISPDLGLFLLEKMRENHYDLIIEFGSGTSTLLFAKGLAIELTRGEPTGESGAVPRRVVTFEHDVRYVDKTRQMLASGRVADLVQLVHAPLIDWSADGQNFLFYDCEATLKGLAAELGGKVASILVLVDGPPGTTGPNARFPAAPVVFNHLARHRIDVVLDDANRPEEKAVAEQWKALFKQRSIRVECTNIPSEKGIFLASAGAVN